MAAQTVEQFLVEQLEKIAPGKYTIANVLQLFKSKLRFPCTHLKGGRSGRLPGFVKDYNLSIFTFPTGVTEIKCLYNCGLKIRGDEKGLSKEFNELYDLPSTNTRATSQVMSKKVDPGPVPQHTDVDRERIRQSTEIMFKVISAGLESGRIKPSDNILGGERLHPDPIEAPESIVERSIKQRYQKIKDKPPVLRAQVVVQDKIPALKPVKIRKARKIQSRQRKRSGK